MYQKSAVLTMLKWPLPTWVVLYWCF